MIIISGILLPEIKLRLHTMHLKPKDNSNSGVTLLRLKISKLPFQPQKSWSQCFGITNRSYWSNICLGPTTQKRETQKNWKRLFKIKGEVYWRVESTCCTTTPDSASRSDRRTPLDGTFYTTPDARISPVWRLQITIFPKNKHGWKPIFNRRRLRSDVKWIKEFYAEFYGRYVEKLILRLVTSIERDDNYVEK